MKLLKSFPLLAFILVLLGIAGLCAAQQSVGLLLVAGTLAAMSWYITEGPRSRTLPRWVSNLLVIAVSLNVFWDLFGHRDDVMGVLGRFAVWLTLIKLYERRTARDHAHLLTLSLLLIMTGCLRTNDLLFGVILVVYVVLGLYVLLLYQLQVSFEHTREARAAAIPAGYRLVPPMKPIIGRHPILHFRATAAGIGLLGVALSLVVFLAFPRDFGADMLGTLRINSGRRVTAFTAQVDLNAGGRITPSHDQVMRVRVTDAKGRVIEGGDALRLRGAALDMYKGRGRWAPSGAYRSGMAVGSSDFINVSRGIEPGDAIVQHVSLAIPADGEVPLFSTYAPEALVLDSPGTVFYEPRLQILKADDGTRHLTGYTIRAQPDPSDESARAMTRGATPLGANAGGRFTDDSGKVRALAIEILDQAGVSSTPPARGGPEHWKWVTRVADAFTRFLQSEKFKYTLDLSDVVYANPDDDPIVRFLTDSRRGHCEYYASGMTALCHVMDIPARLAVGYIAFDYDEAAHEYDVLECNAHAWVEVATGPHRWATYDPTPSAALEALQRFDPSMGDHLRDLYKTLEAGWTTNVENFDGASQGRLADSFNQSWSRRITKALESVRDWMERVNAFFNVGPGGYIWMGFVAAVLVIAVIALVKLMRRSRAIRRTLQLHHLRGAEYQRLLRQLGFYLDMLTVLRRGGLSKPDWQPPMDYATALVRSRPELAPLVRGVTETFYAARYGRARLDRDQVEAARRQVADLAAKLRVRV